MADTRISEQSPPLLDPTQAPVAFGHRALPRLVRELCDEDGRLRHAALCALCVLLHDPERVYESLHFGCLDSLKVLLKDGNDSIRTKSTQVLHLLSTHSIGRVAFLQCDLLSYLSELLDEPVYSCRINVHQTLKMLAEYPAGAASMVSMGLVPRLVTKVPVESEYIQELALSTLTFCMRLDVMPALSSGVVTVLKEQLTHSTVQIRRAAASAMMAIAIPANGKVMVCEEEVVPVLVKLLSDDDPSVRANAAGAIMYITVITQGKLLSLEAGALLPLLHLADSEDVPSCTNALHALTCLAHVPKARDKLREYVSHLKTRLSHPELVVHKAAATAIQVITWRP